MKYLLAKGQNSLLSILTVLMREAQEARATRITRIPYQMQGVDRSHAGEMMRFSFCIFHVPLLGLLSCPFLLLYSFVSFG